MNDAIKIGADLTPEETLRAWAKVLDIPSGRFVNEDLEHAADQLAAKDRENAALLEALQAVDTMCSGGSHLEKSVIAIVRSALTASPAPNPAEAMRAKCEAIARMSDYGTKSMTSQLARRIANQIAALKGNGAGL